MIDLLKYKEDGVEEESSFATFADGNGNIRDLVDSDDTVLAHYEYTPFGEKTASTGSLADANSYQWSSKEFHKESGLVYYLYRFYSPSLGRWINRDPIEERGGLNLYGFVSNSPIDKIDLLGLDVAIVIDPSGANGFGHVGVLIGSDEKGWYYFSLDGVLKRTNCDEQYGVEERALEKIGYRGTASVSERHYNSLEDFWKDPDPEVDRYSRGLKYKANDEQDAKMLYYAISELGRKNTI